MKKSSIKTPRIDKKKLMKKGRKVREKDLRIAKFQILI